MQAPAAKALTVVFAVVVATLPSPAAAPHDRATLFDLRLGLTASQLLPSSDFKDLACGSNGGPAMLSVTDWSEFAACPPDADGLREITFRYDDEAELAARAADDVAAAWSLGTSFDYFPVVVSVLFDAAGRLVGQRMVSDPRYDPRHEQFLHLRPRLEHYLLGLSLMDRFGMTEADCRDVAAAPGETPVLGMFVKQTCLKLQDGVRYAIEARLLRRPGETDVDPLMGTLTEDQYLSETRAEVRLLSPR